MLYIERIRCKSFLIQWHCIRSFWKSCMHWWEYMWFTWFPSEIVLVVLKELVQIIKGCFFTFLVDVITLSWALFGPPTAEWTLRGVCRPRCCSFPVWYWVFEPLCCRYYASYGFLDQGKTSHLFGGVLGERGKRSTVSWSRKSRSRRWSAR